MVIQNCALHNVRSQSRLYLQNYQIQILYFWTWLLELQQRARIEFVVEHETEVAPQID